MFGVDNRFYRHLIFFTVYMVEMIVTMVTLSYFPFLFGMMGLDPIVYGFVGGLALFPMACKFFIGPISDRFPIPFLRGKRKGYLIIGGLLNVILLPFLSINPIEFIVLFLVVWLFQTLGVAVMDIMTDALAISGPAFQSARGRTEASITMFSGTFLGGFIVTQFIPMIMSDLLVALTIFALIGLIPLILVLFLKEQESAKVEETHPSLWGILKENFGYSFVKWGVLFAFVLNIDGGLLELTLEPYLGITLGIPIDAVVHDLFYISMISYVIAFLGYFFIDKVNKNKMLIIIALVYIVPLALLGFFTLTNTLTYTLFLWLYGVFSMVAGLSFVTYTALFFDLSNPKAAGTMIAFFLTITNLGRLAGIMLGGFFTMSTIYFIAVGLTAFRILPLLKIRAAEIEKNFYVEKRSFAWRDLPIVAVPLTILFIVLLLETLYL